MIIGIILQINKQFLSSTLGVISRQAVVEASTNDSSSSTLEESLFVVTSRARNKYYHDTRSTEYRKEHQYTAAQCRECRSVKGSAECVRGSGYRFFVAEVWVVFATDPFGDESDGPEDKDTGSRGSGAGVSAIGEGPSAGASSGVVRGHGAATAGRPAGGLCANVAAVGLDTHALVHSV